MIVSQSSELDLSIVFLRESQAINLTISEYSRMYELDDHNAYSYIRLNRREFEKTDRTLRVGSDIYAERLLIGLLYTDDPDEVRKYVGAICEPDRETVHEVAMPEDESALEEIFMRLEQAGIIKNDRERRFHDIMGNKSGYLWRSFWVMSDMAREYAVRKAVTGKYIVLSEAHTE